jgi:hypothetical protein
MWVDDGYVVTRSDENGQVGGQALDSSALATENNIIVPALRKDKLTKLRNIIE